MPATSSWRDSFPEVASIPDSVARALDAHAKRVSSPVGTRLFGPGTAAKSLLLVLKGTVRVRQLSEAGHEIVLFRVHAGEGCILTDACLIAHADCSAEGIAETDVDFVTIPRDAFDDLMTCSSEFRAFVFKSYSERIADLLHVMEEITFNRVDIRLSERLLELCDSTENLRMTHNQLSIELGTAREVISYQLMEFQRRGWVSLKRGIVTLKDAAALKRLADTR